MQTSQPLDHGVLNVPLAKRGDIDAQLDAYKAQQAREAKVARKAAAEQKKALQVRAKAAVAELSDEQVDVFRSVTGSTRIQARKELKSLAHWQPRAVLALARKVAK